jgi:hypothetical protein
MKLKTSLAAVLFVYSLGLTVYAQDPTGPRPKRARTADDYQVGTLKELAAKAATVDPDLSPTRVTAKYAGSTARTPEPKAQFIREWARRYAGAPETYTRYDVDITFTQKTLTSFLDSDKWSKPIDLFLIKLGAIKQGDDWVPVLLVESFAK